MREEAHTLLWFGKGFTFADVMELTPKEREWFMRRLQRQYKADAAARKK